MPFIYQTEKLCDNQNSALAKQKGEFKNIWTFN